MITRMLPTIEWRDDAVVMVDQRKLPAQEEYVHCRTARDVARAIRNMVIRGAPAIGVAAAMGLALGVRRSRARGAVKLAAEFHGLCEQMAAARPTAVNLFWAIDRMKAAFSAAARAGRIELLERLRERLDLLPGTVSIDDVVIVPPVRLTTVSGFDTAVFSFTTDIPFLDAWGKPLLLGPGSVHVAHSAEEHVKVDELVRSVDLYEKLARELLAGGG